MTTTKSQPHVLWLQVSGVATLQGAITLSWVLYRIYLPQLLASFGFGGLEQTILIIENALAILLEPLMGSLSDRQRHWMGSRFPLIAMGVILASALFIAIPSVFIWGKSFRWILPITLVAWAIAMAIFRSPAIALLGQYATQTQLPQAMSILIVVVGVISAFRPFVQEFILSLGPVLTFAIGSFVLLGSVAILRSVNPNVSLSQPVLNPQPLFWKNLGLIAIIGMCVAWGTRMLLGEIIPKALLLQNPEANLKILMFFILILLAFAALPAGWYATQIGNHRALTNGLFTTAALISLLGFKLNLIVLTAIILALILTYSLVATGTIPFALSLVPPQWGGLGVGLYFGGFSLAMFLYDLGLKLSQDSPLSLWATVGTIAFFIPAIAVKWVGQISYPSQQN